MGCNQKQNDSENVKVIIGKLLNKAEIPIRPVISAFDSVQARSAIIKRLDQFTVPLLESCAEFLGISLSDQKGFKIFAKPALMDRVYFGFRALLPAKCKECSEDYVIDHEPQVQPFFNCFRCFKGSHDCERNRVLHETLSKMNTPAGFVWLCDKCHDIVDPIEPRKHKSRHNSGTVPAGNQSSDSSNELSSIAFQNALSSTQRPPSENTPENHAAPPNETCQNFLNWNCPHGMSGKKEVSGKCCSSIHPGPGCVISLECQGRQEGRVVRRARIVLSSILKSAKLRLTAVHVLKRIVRVFTLAPLERKTTTTTISTVPPEKRSRNKRVQIRTTAILNQVIF